MADGFSFTGAWDALKVSVGTPAPAPSPDAAPSSSMTAPAPAGETLPASSPAGGFNWKMTAIITGAVALAGLGLWAVAAAFRRKKRS